MRINDGLHQSMVNQYNRTNASITKTMGTIASGYRINSAADDASGLAISEKMDAQVTGISTASKNAQDAVSMLQTADGALGNAGDIVQRMNELAMKSSNGVLGKEERQMLQGEFDQLRTELDRIGQSSNFNGNKLFDGSEYTFQIGENTGDTKDVRMSQLTSEKLGLDKIDLTTQEGAAKALDSIKGAVKGISTQRANIGAVQNGLESTIRNLDTNEGNLRESLSRIRDTDIAKAAMNLSMGKTLNQVSIAMMQNSRYLMETNLVNSLLK